MPLIKNKWEGIDNNMRILFGTCITTKKEHVTNIKFEGGALVILKTHVGQRSKDYKADPTVSTPFVQLE